jgi:tetratricopeptide (TPR) repeat protein
MTTSDQLRVLEDAGRDPALLALATVDLTYPELTGPERKSLRTALEAAAVPHWCNGAILAALLDVSNEEALGLWDRLSRLTVVEPFPARGCSVGNVHAAARSAIRRRLARTDGDRLRLLSDRAASQFEGDPRPAARAERLYHLLVTDPDSGTGELEQASSGWMLELDHEARFALSAALTELVEEGALAGRSLTWAQIVVAEHRADVDGAAGLAGLAKGLLSEAEASQDKRLVAEAQSLMGHVAHERGDLAGAQAAYDQYLGIFETLAAKDPANAGWQRGLAVAYSRAGDMAGERGDLAGAHAAYDQYLAISKALAAQDPANAGWQRDLAVAYSRVGDVAGERGDLAGAHAAYDQYLGIFRALAAQDPANAGWQRDLAGAYCRVGYVASNGETLSGPAGPDDEKKRSVEQAATNCRKALDIFLELGDRDGASGAATRLGAALLAVGSPVEAASTLVFASTSWFQEHSAWSQDDLDLLRQARDALGKEQFDVLLQGTELCCELAEALDNGPGSPDNSQ